MLQILFHCSLSLINPLTCSSHFSPVLTVCLLYFYSPRRDKNPSESVTSSPALPWLGNRGSCLLTPVERRGGEDQGNVPVVTAADGSRGGAGNQFLPDLRLVPSHLGIPEGKEKYPKKIVPWRGFSAHAQGMCLLHWRGDRLSSHHPSAIAGRFVKALRGKPCLSQVPLLCPRLSSSARFCHQPLGSSSRACCWLRQEHKPSGPDPVAKGFCFDPLLSKVLLQLGRTETL